MYKAIKYIFALTIIFIGLFIIFKGSLFGGFFITIGGLFIMPPLKNIIKKNFSIWQSRPFRITFIVIIIFVGFGIYGAKLSAYKYKSGIENSDLKESNVVENSLEDKSAKKIKDINASKKNGQFLNYEKRSQKWNENLSENGKKLRADALDKLKATQTYRALIDNNKISAEYLPVLDAINYGIKSSYLNNSNKEMFEIEEDKVIRIEQNQNGKDKMQFVINSILLSFENKGGFPKELIDVFDNYQKEYKYFGTPSKFYNTDGKLVSSVDYEYDFTSIFGLLLPKNKEVLNEMQKAKDESISEFFDDESKKYLYPYLATAEGYINFLKENYRRSKYLPNNFDDKFWDNYDEKINLRILKFILTKNCKALQQEFIIADKNMDSQLARTGTGNSELMGFIDENMRKIGCYY